MKKIILIAAVFILLAITAAALWTYSTFFYSKPLSQQELTILTPDWSKITKNNWSPWHNLPDGTKEWNPSASYNTWIESIPEEDKAWPILVDEWYENLEYTRDLPYGFFPEEDLLWETYEDEYKTERFHSIANQLVTAANKPYMGIGLYDDTDPYEYAAYINHDIKASDWQPSQNYSPNPLILGTLFADLGRSRSASQFLKSAAISALLDNNPDDYIRYTIASIEIANLSVQFPTAIHQLVQIAILAEATDLVRWGLTNNTAGFTTQQLNQLDESLAQYHSIHYIWQGEVLQFHDSFRRFAGPDGKISLHEQALKIAGLQGLSAEGTPAHLPDYQLGQSIQRPLLIHNQLNKHASENSKTLFNDIDTSSLEIFEQSKSSLNEVTRPLIEILVSALPRITSRFRGVNQQLRATRIAIALHIYHNTYNQFPKSLDQLNLPDDMLLDEFTGKQLLYKLTATTPILYSTGDNRVDNDATQRFTAKDHGSMGNPHPYSEPRYPMFFTYQDTQQFVEGAPIYDTGDWVLYPLPFGDPKPIYIDDEDLP